MFLQVTADGTVYVGHQDMTVKKYLPLDAANGANRVADSLPVSPRLMAGNTAMQQVRTDRPVDTAWHQHSASHLSLHFTFGRDVG